MKKRKRILGVLMLFMMIGMLLACTKEDEGQNSIENVQIEQEKEEDIQEEAMQDENMQNNMVQGIANGIDKYFGF